MSSSASDNTAVPPPKPKRPRLLRLQAVVGLPLLLAVTIIAYNLMIDGAIKDFLVNQGKSMAGTDGGASVEDVKFSIFGPKLYVRNFHIYQAPANAPIHTVLRAGEANLDLELWPLLERRLVIKEIRATKLELQRPLSAAPEAPPPQAPPETENKDANGYLKQIEDFFKSDEFREIREWLEKLRKQDQPAPAPGGEAKTPQPQAPVEGPAGRADWVEKALSADGVKPAVVVQRAALEQLDFNFGKAGDKSLKSRLTDVKLEAKEVSSDPVAYGQPITMSAGGNLGGDKEKRLDLDLVVRFDAKQLIKLEQVRGNASYTQVPLKGIVDTSIFGDSLRDLRMSVTYYAPEHREFSGRACVSLSGLIQPPTSLDMTGAKLSVNIWLGGYKGTDAAAMLMPSGIGFSVERMPLAGLLKQAGGFPLALEPGATLSLGTCDARGRTDTPEAAFTWHDGINVKLRLKLDNLRFAGKQSAVKDTAIPSEFLARGLNNFLAGLSKSGREFELIVGFDGRAKDFKLGIEKPGMRTFVDAAINALQVNANELEAAIKPPFAIDNAGTLSLQSVDAAGNPRVPNFDVEAAPDHNLGDLRVALKLDKLAIKPRAGADKILGFPAKDFCAAFNTFMSTQGKGAAFQFKLLDAKGSFAPALEKPGTRGLIDGIVAVLAYSGAEANKSFDLPFTLSDKATIKCASINADGAVRTMFGPDSGRSDLADLRIRVLVKDVYAAKKAGRNEVMGIPADNFTFAWNAMVASFPAEGFPFVLRLFNDKGVFEPSVVGPTPTQLTTMLGTAVGIQLFEKNFGQLATKFGPQFAQFQKGGLAGAPDIAKALAGGKIIDPKTLPVPIPPIGPDTPKELPKIPVPIPKLPW